MGIALSQFNADITEGLLRGALRELEAAGVAAENIAIERAPGSFELPLACQRLARTGRYDALVALGCVIKGGTDHYYYIAGEAARGIMDVMLAESIPIGLGVITARSVAQARARSSGKTNIGASAASAALSMAAGGVREREV